MAKKASAKSSENKSPKAAAGKKTAVKKGSSLASKVARAAAKVEAKATAKQQRGGETDFIRRISLKQVAANKQIPAFGPGDTIGVYVKVREGDKERVQLYKGVCIKTQGEGPTKTFTVRKISAGVGVERTFPFRSPSVDRVEVYSYGQVRRSKLYFLRTLKGKAARLTSELAGLVDENSQGAAAADDAGSAPASN